MSLEDIADVLTVGGYTAISGTKSSTVAKLGKVGEGIVKNISGEYEAERQKASARAAAAQERQSAIEAQKARLAQQREARIRTAQVLASSTTVGTGSSGVAGAIGSIGSQTASNISGININEELSTQALRANQEAANIQGQMALSSAQLGLATTIFSGVGGFETIFGKPIKQQKVAG